ncbi:uncharacterized protein [Drosophila bipectinata]|uniref:uncharacterized protein n=1 Tax=Drosophila bipectinata TaxID=42026 RepID=UPI001C8AD25C|nr:uncharacterized protein LOC108129825 [Drosophila bipectinata]
MCSRKQYLDWVCPFLVERPLRPYARDRQPHELLLQAICRQKKCLPHDQLADLLRNLTVGSTMRRLSKSRKRQCGGSEVRPEPTDAEVVFLDMRKSSPHADRCSWGRSRIEWLQKLEQQQNQYLLALHEPSGGPLCKSPSRISSPTKSRSKDKVRSMDKDIGLGKRKIPGCWALMPFFCGWSIPRTDSVCVDVSRPQKSS